MQIRTAAVLPWVALGGFAFTTSVANAGAGDHVRFGSGGELAPSLSVAGVYRTNNYLTVGERVSGDADDASIGGIHLNVRPQLAVGWKGKAIEAGFDGGYDLRKYFNEDLTNLDRYKNFDARGRLNILPKGVVGIKLDSGVTVTGRETEAVNSQDAYLQQLVFRNTAMLAIRPGNAMELDVGGVFENRVIKVPEGFALLDDGSPTANLNERTSAGLISTFNWQFLPKTAIVAGFERFNSTWDSNTIAASGDGVGDFAIQPQDGTFVMCDPFDAAGATDCFLPVPNGVFTSFDAGIRGRFTEKLIIGAVLGFTRADFDSTTVEVPFTDPDTGAESSLQMREDGSDDKCGDRNSADGVNDDLRGFPCSLNGNFEIRYDIRKNHKLTVGFLRDTQPVFFTNYLNLNRYYIGYTGRFADRHAASLNFDVNQQFYRGQVVRDDLWYRVRGDIGWGVQKWLIIDTGVWYTARRTADGAYGSIEYDDVNIHAGITLTY